LKEKNKETNKEKNKEKRKEKRKEKSKRRRDLSNATGINKAKNVRRKNAPIYA
jgi:hypothetical protein